MFANVNFFALLIQKQIFSTRFGFKIQELFYRLKKNIFCHVIKTFKSYQFEVTNEIDWL
jgi:hypothetical protein